MRRRGWYATWGSAADRIRRWRGWHGTRGITTSVCHRYETRGGEEESGRRGARAVSNTAGNRAKNGGRESSATSYGGIDGGSGIIVVEGNTRKRSPLWFTVPLRYTCNFVMCLFLSEAHSAINLGRSNISAIRFFGLFIAVLLVYMLSYNPNTFAEKYLDKLLSFYILVFSFSITIDFVILHSALDIS